MLRCKMKVSKTVLLFVCLVRSIQIRTEHRHKLKWKRFQTNIFIVREQKLKATVLMIYLNCMWAKKKWKETKYKVYKELKYGRNEGQWNELNANVNGKRGRPHFCRTIVLNEIPKYSTFTASNKSANPILNTISDSIRCGAMQYKVYAIIGLKYYIKIQFGATKSIFGTKKANWNR